MIGQVNFLLCTLCVWRFYYYFFFFWFGFAVSFFIIDCSHVKSDIFSGTIKWLKINFELDFMFVGQLTFGKSLANCWARTHYGLHSLVKMLCTIFRHSFANFMDVTWQNLYDFDVIFCVMTVLECDSRFG